jgi:hypothetical protein
MNQHEVQEAYLKKFAAPNGRIWVYSKLGGTPLAKPPSECAAAEDFQSEQLEFYQQQIVESAGIKALRVNGSLSDKEFQQMSMWMGLHIIRTKKAREKLFESPADYEQRFHDEFRKEKFFSAYYRYAYVHVVAEPNFVVTSDNPVVEFTCANFYIRACALSPHKLIFFSPNSGKLEHELPLHDFFNAMMWGSSGEHIYSHRPDLNVEQLERFVRDYNLLGATEHMLFRIVGGKNAL